MKTLRVLLVEDSHEDAERQVDNLESAGYSVYSRRVATAGDLRKALVDDVWDVVLSDYRLSDLTGLETLEILREGEYDIPVIIISGSIGEEAAASLMRHGIGDYLIKDNLMRLAPAVAREIQEAHNRRVKREAEKALEESESRLQMALSAAGMGAWEWDLQTNDVFWSPECSLILGIPIAGTQAPDVHRLILDEDKDAVAEKFRLAIARRSSFSVRFRVKRRDGETVWLSETGKCEYDAKGKPIRMVGTLRDITRDKKAEDALIEAEERYRVMAESASDAVISIDENSIINFANAAAETIFGYTSAELVGEPISIIQPDDAYDAHRSGILRYLETGERNLDWRNVETAARRKDGTPIDVHISFGVYHKANRHIFTAFIRDITEKKQIENAVKRSERNFRALTDATTQFVWQLDGGGNLIEYPQWWMALTGQRYDESVDHGWLEPIHPDDRDRVARDFAAAMKSGTPLKLEVRIRDTGGKYRHYSARGVPIDNDASGRRWICALEEITAQRKAEEMLRSSEQRYRLISSISTDYMYSADVNDDGTFHLDWVAGAFERITGYTRDGFVANGGWPAIVHPADVEKDLRDFAQLQRNEPVDSELRIVNRSGETVWIRSYAQPVWDDKRRKLTGICGAVQDITARKAAEQSLRERENHLRTILDAEPECVKVLNLKGEIIDINPAGLAFLEVDSVDQVVGLTADGILNPDHVEPFKKAIAEVSRGGRAELDYEITGLRGTKRWLSMQAVPMRDGTGEIASIIAVSRDVTEKREAELSQRQSEAWLRSVFDQSAVGMGFVGTDGTWLKVNDRFCQLLGYTRSEFTALRYQDITHPDDHELDAEVVRELQSGTASTFSFEKRYLHKDGHPIWINLSGEAHRDDRGKIDYFVSIVEDISVRKTAEQELQKSEARYRHLFENNPYPMWIYDVETLDFLAVNEAAILSYGYAVNEFLSMKITDIRPPEDIERVRQKAKETNLRIDTSGVWRHTKKDGTVINVEITSHSLEVEGRRARLVLANEVTERVRAERALRRSEEKYRELIENANDLIYTHDMDGNFTSLNRAGERIIGYTEAEVLTMNVRDLLSPNDLRRARVLMASRADNDSDLFEVEVRARDGRSVSLEINLRRVMHDGKLTGVQGVARDVTERNAAEEELRRRREQLEKTSEASPVLIYSFRFGADGSRTMPYASPAIKDVFGFTAEEALADAMCIFERIHPDDRESMEETMARSIRELAPVHATFKYAHPAGKEVWIEVHTSPNAEEDGGIIWHGIAADITDQVGSRTALEETQQQLQQAQKLESIGILAGGMAHDFNNMLTAINGYSDLALRKLKSDDPIRRNIEEIRKAGERSAELTRQLLAFSRRQIMLPKVLNINEVIEETSTMLRRLIGENIQVTTKLDARLGSVEADPGQLSQILVNFVINSRDAMPNGGSIVIETANVELDENYASRHVSVEPGSYVMLAVSDNGVGMDEATRQRIFEPFFTTKEVGRGTGLGLSTVYGIVKQSGGNIWVYSEPGKGTTFKIYLPRVSRPAALNGGPEFRNSMRGTETILLVEDEEAVRHLSREILETCGYTVIEASNGAEALELCEMSKLRIDLLMTDIVMPELGGRELAEILTKKRPALKVLFTSGYTDDVILRHGIIDEGTNFLQKPFTFDDLSKIIRNMLDS